MKLLNFIYRFYLNKKVLVTFLIITAVSSVLIVFGRLNTLDTLVYAFSPPIELLFFAITILFLFALKNRNYELFTSLLSGFLVLLLVWPLYYLMIINFPPVITQIPPGDITGYLLVYLTSLLVVTYFIVIQILSSKKRNLNKIIKFNTIFCMILTVLFVIIDVQAVIDDFSTNIICAASYDQMLQNMSVHLFFIPIYIVYICSFNIVVSLQTIKYLINRGLLDEYI